MNVRKNDTTLYFPKSHLSFLPCSHNPFLSQISPLSSLPVTFLHPSPARPVINLSPSTATIKIQSKFPSGIFNFGSKQQATDSLSFQPQSLAPSSCSRCCCCVVLPSVNLRLNQFSFLKPLSLFKFYPKRLRISKLSSSFF